MRRVPILTLLACLILLAAIADPVLATQAHDSPEGTYTHQFSHLFFALAMATLAYWLRSRGLSRQPGWREIGYGAVFFILWTLDAYGVHLIDEQFEWVRVVPVGKWNVRLAAPDGSGWLAGLYYLMKMDHLLAVPGMVLIAIGLKQLNRSGSGAGPPEGNAP